MASSTTAINEQARLAELRSLDLDHATGDPRLDQLARLTSDLFEVPVALVTLVDSERQTFFANCGLEDLHGTPRSDAFCHRTMEHDELMVVPDAVLDPRFSSNPLVTGDPCIRFYAGAVLRGPHGHALGSLCLIDYVPRTLDERDQRRLLHVARVAESILVGGLPDAPAVERPALRDPVTGLPERHELLDRLGTILRDPVAPATSVLAVHVDGLPELQTTIGADATAAFVRTLAERFREVLPRQATIGRWDSSEFTVLVPAVGDADPDVLADRLAGAADAPVTVSGQPVRRSLSIGIARSPADGNAAHLLVDQARVTARGEQYRRSGGSRIATGHQVTDTRRQVDIAPRLQGALTGRRIHAHFQPRVAIADARIAGAEALARWHDDTLGWISPVEFVPMAERAGLINALTTRMIDSAVEHAARWRRELDPRFRVSVNLSAGDLLDESIVARTRSILAEHGAQGEMLEFEVTESALVADVDRAIEQMLALKELGVRFAIDDFGTGYSSFQYLRQLPVDVLKIDRGFVGDIVGNADAAAIMQAICSMAQSLGIETVAEGVETMEQLTFLKAYRCCQAQGFLYSPAVPPSRLQQFLLEGFSEGSVAS